MDDTYLATVTCEGGALAQLMWSWAGRGEETPIPGAPVFYGSRGCIKGGEIVADNGGRRNLLDTFWADAEPELLDTLFPVVGSARLTDAFAIQQYDWLQAIERGEPTGDRRGRGLARLGRGVGHDRVLYTRADRHDGGAVIRQGERLPAGDR